MSSGTVCDLYVAVQEALCAEQCKEDGGEEIVALALATEGAAVCLPCDS